MLRRSHILNISIDRDLASYTATESLQRQVTYANKIPLKITILVKTPRFKRGYHAKPFHKFGVQIIPCPVLHSLFFPIAAYFLGKKLLKQIDVVQTQDPFFSGLAGYFLSRTGKKPLLIGAYGDEIDNFKWIKWHLSWHMLNVLGKFLLRRADGVRTDSRDVARKLTKFNKHVRYIPFPIPNAQNIQKKQLEAAGLRIKLLEERKGPLFLAVSRIEPQKNIPLLLKAFREHLRNNPGACLTLVGDGTLRKRLEKQTESYPAGSVLWLGRKSAPDLPAYYQAADLLVLSSDHESSARVLTEAQLAGTAVLTTNTSGASDAIVQGRSGMVVPVGDVAAFTKALNKLGGNLKLLKKMGKYGQSLAIKKIDSERIIREMREMYQALIKKGKK